MQAPKLTSAQLAVAQSLYEDGEPVASIARQFDVRTAAIRKRARKHGWPRPTGTWFSGVASAGRGSIRNRVYHKTNPASFLIALRDSDTAAEAFLALAMDTHK